MPTTKPTAKRPRPGSLPSIRKETGRATKPIGQFPDAARGPATLSPFLHFNGNCREALTWYHSCLGGKLSLQTLSQSDPHTHFPPEMGQLIFEGRLSFGNFQLWATDLAPEPLVHGTQMAIYLTSKDREYLIGVHKAMASPANLHPFDQWAQFQDRFGVNWILRWIPQ